MLHRSISSFEQLLFSFFLRRFYLSTRFLCLFEPWIFCHLPSSFRVYCILFIYLFIYLFFGCCKCWLLWISYITWHDMGHTRFFYMHDFHKGWNWQKNKQKLSNTLRLYFCYLKITSFLQPYCHPKSDSKYFLKCAKKQVCIFQRDYIINYNENEKTDHIVTT